MIYGMKEGVFTGLKLSKCTTGGRLDYLKARGVINSPNNIPFVFERHAQLFEALIRETM